MTATIEREANNVDGAEVAKFTALAAAWWDPLGPSRTLHEINPCRLAYIAQHAQIAKQRVLDVGCGGGLLTEAMAQAGAIASGIDASAAVIAAARTHAAEHAQRVHYEVTTAESHATRLPGHYAILTCMELLEHVPDPAQLLAACRTLLAPDGEIFLSTINRTPRAYGAAVLGAEYLLRLLPAGTHDFRRFIRPSELGRWLRAAGFEVAHIAGMRYDPFRREAALCAQVGVNYLIHARVRA